MDTKKLCDISTATCRISGAPPPTHLPPYQPHTMPTICNLPQHHPFADPCLNVSRPVCTVRYICFTQTITVSFCSLNEKQSCCVWITGFLMRLHLPFLKHQERLQQWAGTSKTPLWLLAGQLMLLQAMAHSVLLLCMVAEFLSKPMNHSVGMRHYLFEYADTVQTRCCNTHTCPLWTNTAVCRAPSQL